MSGNFLLKKNIDCSVIKRGFVIPAEMQAVFSLHLSGGALNHGENNRLVSKLNKSLRR